MEKIAIYGGSFDPPHKGHRLLADNLAKLEEMVNKILELDEGTKIMVMAPVVQGEKGTHKDTLENLRRDGFIRCKIDGEIRELSENIELDKNKKHIISVVVDRLVIKDGIRTRLFSSLETAANLSHGKVIIDEDKLQSILTQNNIYQIK